MNEKLIKKIFIRLDRLENAVFRTKQRLHRKSISQGNFTGAIGGIRYLISKGFFKTKRELAETRKTLSDNEYHYSRQAIHGALKYISKANGPLVILKEKGRKFYVKRK